MRPFFHYSPVKIIFADGAINQLPQHLYGAKSVLVVTGISSAIKTGLVDRIRELLKNAGVTTIEFASVGSNPTISEVNAIAEIARSSNTGLIVGVGGGSAMDAAKAASVVATNSAPFHDLLKVTVFGTPPLPLVLVPTTAGTGSEVNQYAIITDEDMNDKVNLSGENTYPALALLDPELSVSMPHEITVDTGIDALCHAVEGYVSLKDDPISDILALEVFRIVREALPAACNDGTDLDARGRMLYASALAGIVIAHCGTTVVHAMGYHLTLKYGVSHGRANAALIAHCLKHIYDGCPDKIGRFFGIFGGPSDKSGADVFLEFLHSLGVGTRLRDYRVNEEGLEEYCHYVLARKNIANTPGQMTESDMMDLLNSIL